MAEAAPTCPACGYDLRATPTDAQGAGVCPECGRGFDPMTRMRFSLPGTSALDLFVSPLCWAGGALVASWIVSMVGSLWWPDHLWSRPLAWGEPPMPWLLVTPTLSALVVAPLSLLALWAGFGIARAPRFGRALGRSGLTHRGGRWCDYAGMALLQLYFGVVFTFAGLIAWTAVFVV